MNSSCMHLFTYSTPTFLGTNHTLGSSDEDHIEEVIGNGGGDGDNIHGNVGRCGNGEDTIVVDVNYGGYDEWDVAGNVGDVELVTRSNGDSSDGNGEARF